VTVRPTLHQIQRPPVGRWLFTGSFWVLVVMTAVVIALWGTGHPWWAAPFALPLGIALPRWAVRAWAYWQPFRFRPEWLQAHGWTVTPRSDS
jgi:hypothetical protein